MKPIRFLLILFVALFVTCTFSKAQNKKPIPVFTADSLASGNYKDVLTSFFQLAFDNLVGTKRELRFTTNPYALMMRANPDLAVDTSYLKYTALRNLNFGFGLRLDSSFRFNGFSSGVNYAIINRRDHTVYREFLDSVEAWTVEYTKLTQGLSKEISARANAGDREFATRAINQFDSITQSDGKFTFDQLDADVKDLFKKVATDSSLKVLKKVFDSNQKVNFFTETQKPVERAKELFKNRLLWTVGVTDTTYKDQFFFSNVVISTQILKGFSKPFSRNGIEFDIKGNYNFLDDTLISGRDLKRSLLNFEGGINYVRRHKSTDISFFEFEFSASYKRVFNGIYAQERKEIFTLLGTIRFRIYDDIWIPLEFEYDPAKGNLFGIINLKVNFTALKNAIAQNKK